APGDAFAGAKGAQHLVFVEPDRGGHVPGRRDEYRAVLVGEDHGLLGRQLVGIASRVVHDVATGGLAVEPVAYIALGASGPLRDLGRAQRAGVAHRPVEAALVAETDHHAA